MSAQNLRWLRMTKFIEELKKNNYPTVPHMLKILRDLDIDKSIPCACSERTFRRDIESLKVNYNAPIDFDCKKQGYYLTNPKWQFDVPVFTVPKVKARVDTNTLRILFDANREHHVVTFTYTRPNGENSSKIFEPHVITLYNGIWYVRGIERQSKEQRTYAVQRISKITATKDTFTPNKKLVADTKKNGPFDFPKIHNARLRVHADAAFFFQERAENEGYKITPTKDGALFVDLPPIIESELLRFVLGGLGYVQLVKPANLRASVISLAKDVIAANK